LRDTEGQRALNTGTYTTLQHAWPTLNANYTCIHVIAFTAMPMQMQPTSKAKLRNVEGGSLSLGLQTMTIYLHMYIANIKDTLPDYFKGGQRHERWTSHVHHVAIIALE